MDNDDIMKMFCVFCFTVCNFLFPCMCVFGMYIFIYSVWYSLCIAFLHLRIAYLCKVFCLSLKCNYIMSMYFVFVDWQIVMLCVLYDVANKVFHPFFHSFMF